jgi:alkanesulfonate monooxygenase SsuD/methylene tetrahydromethanopterin reductase-like flavin-dependent oxidoreductase (luciferase family)
MSTTADALPDDTEQDTQGETWVTHPWVEAGRKAIGFGIVNGPRGDLPALTEFVLQVEEHGLDGFWVTDHPVWYPDSLITLAALAGVTKRIRLGTLVNCVPYRNPLLLARMTADIDALSNGRLVVGLGMGDNDDEFKQMGIALRSIRERQEMLDETARTLRWLWGDAPSAPAKRQYSVSAEPLKPAPVQRPRIPILIAGGGERVTLRQVAEHADASNFGQHYWTGAVQGDDGVRRRLAALRGWCEQMGRPYDSVLKTNTTFPLIIADTRSAVADKLDRYVPPFVRQITTESIVAGTPDEVIAHYAPLVRAGLQQFLAMVYGSDIDTVRLLAERVVPELRDLQAGIPRR